MTNMDSFRQAVACDYDENEKQKKVLSEEATFTR